MRTILAIGASALLGAGAVAQSDRMRVVDPLGGSWRPVRIGALAVPAEVEARLFFNSGSEYSTQAGCGNFGGTYSLDGARIRTRPRDEIHTGKCRDRASARLELALAGFIAQAASYELLPDGTLRILARDGRAGTFRRPLPAIPALDGRWTVERIGRDASPPARRARLHFREHWVSAVADCNSFGARVTPAGGGFTVSGGAATQMGCDRERLAFDDRLFAAVGKARRFVPLPGGRIRLEGAGEPLVLRRPAPLSPSLPGTYSACRSNPRGVTYDGVATITFTRSEVRDSAGCTAAYRNEGALLALTRDGSKACAPPPASLNPAADVEIGERKSVLAALRPDAYAFDEEGVLRLRTTRGILDMCRAGEPRPFGS
ncbi:MAG TPA: META domain-containing protein [Allosphingosinicella sp.]|jgi:heat shock protein HslJ